MVRGIGGVVTGMLAIAAFDAVVSDAAAAGRVGGLANVISAGFQRLISPSVPAIPVHGTNTHPYTAAFNATPSTGPAPPMGPVGPTGAPAATRLPVPPVPTPTVVNA